MTDPESISVQGVEVPIDKIVDKIMEAGLDEGHYYLPEPCKICGSKRYSNGSKVWCEKCGFLGNVIKAQEE